LDEPLTPLNMTQGDEPADEPKEPQDDAQAKQIEVLERKLFALESRQAPLPVINNYVTTPDVKSETHVHNATPAAPNVEVRNEINVPETVVNVEAVMPEQKSAETPIVQITNTVQPADVVVNNAFPTKAVQTVQRDERDEITSTTTKYEV